VKIFFLKEIKAATYFSVLLDSTPDVSHTHRMAFVVRYVKVEESEAQIKEPVFLPTARENRRTNYQFYSQ